MRNNQLTIIEIAAREDGGHGLQSQSGRTECWMEGWIAVPDELADAAWDCGGYCDLDIQGSVLVGITPREKPEPVPTPEEQIAALKAELDATDYQIVKCSEYQLAAPASKTSWTMPGEQERVWGIWKLNWGSCSRSCPTATWPCSVSC